MSRAALPKFSASTMSHRWPTTKPGTSEYLKRGDGEKIKRGTMKKMEAPVGPPKAGAFAKRDASDARARIEGCRWDEYNAVIMNDESRQDDGETLPVDRGERGERFEVGLEGDARGVRSDEEDLGLGDVELEELGAE